MKDVSDDELYEIMNVVIELHENGESIRKIAKKTGFSKENISELLHIIYTDEELEAMKKKKRIQSRNELHKKRNTSGIFRVTFNKAQKYGNDFWSYNYRENGKIKRITSVNLYKLKTEVIDRGLEWEELTEEGTRKVEEAYKEYASEPVPQTNCYRVHKEKSNTKQGYSWAYSFKENGETKKITSVNLYKLKTEVIAQGLKWEELTEEGIRLVEEAKEEYNPNPTNQTGYYRVLKAKRNTKQGYTWIYSFKEKGKSHSVSSLNLDTLKKKVLEKGWEWKEL